MTFSFIRTIVFSAATFALLAGCQQRKADPISEHEPEKISASQQIEKQAEPESIPKQQSASLNVFNEEVLLDAQKTTSDSFKKQLSEKLQEMMKSPKTDTADFKAFENVVFLGCNNNLQSCKNVSVFKMDPLSSAVLQRLCQTKERIDSQYRCLQMAFDIKNTSYQSELYEQYAQRSAEYFEWLKSHSDEQKKAQHRRVMGLIIDEFIKLNQTDRLQKLAIDYAADQASQKTRHDLGDHVFKLKPYIRKISKKSSEFYRIQEELFRTKATLMKKFSIEALPIDDLVVHTLDQVFTKDLSPDQALKSLSQQSLKAEDFYQTWRTYLQIRFLDRVLSSHKNMSKEFKVLDQNSSNEVIKRVFESGELETIQWEMFTSAAQAYYSMGKSFLSQLQAFDLVDKMQTHIQSLPRSIKYMVMYPQMMMTGYYLSKMKFSLTVNTQMSAVSIDAGYIFSKFFTGQWEPWFSYTRDNTKLTSLEILLSLQWAFELEVFQNFSISSNSFLAVAMKEILQPFIIAIKNTEDNMTYKYEQAAHWHYQLKICEGIKKNIPIENVIPATEIKESLLMGDKIKIFGNSDEIVGGRWGTYLYSNSVQDMLEAIRVEHDPVVRRLQLVLDLLKNQPTLRQSARVKDASFADLSSILQNYKDHKEHFLKRYVSMDEKYGSCFLQFNKAEKLLRTKVLTAEEAFFRSVHKDMLKIQKDSSLAESLNAKYQFIAQPETGQRVRFDGRNLIFYNFDFYKRVEMYFSKGVPWDSSNSGPLTKQAQIAFPNNLFEMAEFKDANKRIISFTEDENEFVSRGLSIFFKVLVSKEDAFVNWYGGFNFYAIDLVNWVNQIAIVSRIFNTDPALAEKIPWNFQEHLQRPLDLVQFISFTKEEKDFFKKIKVDQMYPVSSLYYFISDNQIVPYYDYLSLWLYENYIGGFATKPRTNIIGATITQVPTPPKSYISLQKEWTDYANYKSSDRSFLLSAKGSFDEKMYILLKDLMKKHESFVSSAIQNITKIYESDRQQNNITYLEYIVDQKTPVPYLSDAARQNAEAYFKTLHRQTQGLFLDSH